MGVISNYIRIFREEKEKLVKEQEFERAAMFYDMERELGKSKDIYKFINHIKSRFFYMTIQRKHRSL